MKLSFNKIIYYLLKLLQGDKCEIISYLQNVWKKFLFGNYEIVNCTSTTFLVKIMWNIFPLCRYFTIIFFCMMVALIVAETALSWYLKIYCEIDFKCSSTNFHEQRKWPVVGHCSFKHFNSLKMIFLLILKSMSTRFVLIT